MPIAQLSTRSKGPARWLKKAGSWVARLAGKMRVQSPRNACPRCGFTLSNQPQYRELGICDNCGFHLPVSPHRLIHLIADPGTFVSLERTDSVKVWRQWFARPKYRARELEDAVVTGQVHVKDEPAILIAFNFRNHGGTMGVQEGRRISEAFRCSSERGLPVIAYISSGGVRIQQGVPALAQMASTVQAVHDLVGQRPFVAILASPSTGGVYASFASLADIIVAEPAAVVGFAGPRVAQAATGEMLPPGSHRAEKAMENGMVDAIVKRQDLRDVIYRVIASSGARVTPTSAVSQTERTRATRTQLETLALARRNDRPTARDYISRIFTDFFELRGDRILGDDPTIIGGLVRLDGQSAILIAQQRQRIELERGAGPAGYRKAQRLISLAGRLGLPVVTFVDTPGADPGFESERHGIAGAIAHCLEALLSIPVPTISVILGEGTSGGAIALAAADCVWMQENAIYTAISAEGGSTILFGDVAHADQVAASWGMTADDLIPQGIVDHMVPEPAGGAHTDYDASAAEIKTALAASLADLLAMDSGARLASRRRRYGGS